MGLAIRDLTLRAPADETRPTLMVVDDAREITLNGLRGSPCIGVVEQRAGIDDRWRAGPRKRVAHPRIERASARRSDGGAVVDADVPAGAAAFVQ